MTASTASSHLLPVFARAPIAFARGEGCWLIAETGERYLDFGSGVAVNALGHAHPALVAAIADQAAKVMHVSNLYQVPGAARAADRLCALSFADTVFFANSGAEALECAIKMARKYHAANGAPQRMRIITFAGAFHGRTLATLAAGGNAKYLDGFGTPLDGFDQVEPGDMKAVRAVLSDETAAILIEPIQGEGGVRVVPPQFLRDLRALCDERGLLLIFDEVQTGMGRTGAMFAYERVGVAPDIMALAKGIGGGFPVSACLATRSAAAGMTVGSHGSTFGGNPLAMAAVNAVLDVVTAPGFLDHVKRMELMLRQKLASLRDHFPDVIAEVRGEGLLLGLKAVVPAADLMAAAREEKLLTVAAGDNVVRLLPPLIVSDEEINDALQRLERACARLDAQSRQTASAQDGAS